jgi:hypothetical protein
MGSRINIDVVKRHLDSVGHKMSSQGIADLLQNLGFTVSAEEEKERYRLPKQKIYERVIAAKPREEPLLPSRTNRGVSTTTDSAAATASTARNRAPARGGAIESLAAKLDELETQLNAINNLQTNLHRKLDSDQRRRPRPVPVAPATLVSLGSEAEQLRDWAAGKWPNIQKFRARTSSSEGSETCSSGSSSSSYSGKQRGVGKATKFKKRDPVARYQ